MQERLVTLSHELAAAEESQQVQDEAAAATATAAEAQHDKDELREQLEHRLQAEEGTSTKYEHTRFGLPMPFRVWNLMPQHLHF
jgi:hypothetical protein